LVPTNSGLASFVLAMENIFSSYPKIKFINSCEGGARKKYCEQMSFKKALKDFCSKKINKTKINKYLSFKPQFEKDIWEAKRRLNWEIALFEKIIDACDNGLKPLKSMQGATENELKELLLENEKFATMAQELTKQSNILSLHIYKTSREIHKRELKVNGKTKHLLKDKEDLEIRIKRSSLILEAAKESALKLKKIYIEVYKEMVDLTDCSLYGSWTNKNNLVLNSVNLHLEKMDKWDKLLENGNWARPLLESNEIMEEYMTDPTKIDVWRKANLYYYKSLSMKLRFLEQNEQRKDLTNEIEINKFIELSREYGLKKDFKKALKYLKKALKINSLKVEVIWGLATTYHHLEKVNKALKYYKFLVKCYPENNKRYRFEMGQTYLMKDIQKGMEIISNVMEETHEFDSFYIRLAELEFGMENYYKAKEYCEKFLMVYSHSIEAKNLLDRINKIEKPY
jgi:tetratricopeptide (TPR) repeat protein